MNEERVINPDLLLFRPLKLSLIYFLVSNSMLMIHCKVYNLIYIVQVN